jgi:hypothetical protein
MWTVGAPTQPGTLLRGIAYPLPSGSPAKSRIKFLSHAPLVRNVYWHEIVAAQRFLSARESFLSSTGVSPAALSDQTAGETPALPGKNSRREVIAPRKFRANC